MHEYNESVEKTINSVYSSKDWTDEIEVIVVGPELDKIKSSHPYTKLWADSKLYCELANAGIKFCEKNSEYVSILEYDDELTENAIRVFNRYSEKFKDDDVLAGLSAVVKHIENDKKVLLSIVNETALAPGMADDFGLFDFNMLLRSNYLFVNGLFMKTKIFSETGYFKPSLKMFYDYEFSLRLVYVGLIVRTIPKITHYHYINQNGASNLHKIATQKERDFWIGTARKEYFFTEDRNVVAPQN